MSQIPLTDGDRGKRDGESEGEDKGGREGQGQRDGWREKGRREAEGEKEKEESIIILDMHAHCIINLITSVCGTISLYSRISLSIAPSLWRIHTHT